MSNGNGDAVTTGIPRIGDIAPDFTQLSTHGEIKFHDWIGDSWCLLFSHPADFTPVCSTELAELARRNADFEARGVKQLGLSIDSIHSHLAWRENLKQCMAVELPFPMLADIDMKVASLYGMIHPGASSTVTVRAVFIIDPKKAIRALVYYPLNVGRSVDEIVRLIDGLQTADKHGVALPVNWVPGEMVVVPAPKTVADVAERASHPEYERIDFYLNKKQLNA